MAALLWIKIAPSSAPWQVGCMISTSILKSQSVGTTPISCPASKRGKKRKISIQKLSYRKIEYNISYYGDFKILSKLLNVNKLKVNNINNECEIKLK